MSLKGCHRGRATTTTHAPHLLMFALPLVVFAALFWWEWRRTSARPLPQLPRAVVVMAAGSMGAAAAHTAVTEQHFDEATLLGGFFVLLALAQTGFAAVLLARPVRRVVELGVLANLGIVCLWVWTRIVGIPLGIAGGGREAVEVIDLVATGLEMLCVAAGLLHLYRTTGGGPSPAEAPVSKWGTSTKRNSPLRRKVSSPAGLPSHETNSRLPDTERDRWAT